MEPCLGAYDGRSVGLVTSVRRTAPSHWSDSLRDGRRSGRGPAAAGRGARPRLRAPSRRIQVARHEFRHVPRGARQTRQSVFQARGLFQAFSRASVIAQHAEQVRLPAFNRSFVIRQPRTGRGRASDTVKT